MNKLFAPPAGYTSPTLTAHVASADGFVFELAETLERAQDVADWNSEEDPLNRAHEAAYPFRAEMRPVRA